MFCFCMHGNKMRLYVHQATVNALIELLSSRLSVPISDLMVAEMRWGKFIRLTAHSKRDAPIPDVVCTVLFVLYCLFALFVLFIL